MRSNPTAIWSGEANADGTATITVNAYYPGEEWTDVAVGSDVWTTINPVADTWLRRG